MTGVWLGALILQAISPLWPQSSRLNKEIITILGTQFPSLSLSLF